MLTVWGEEKILVAHLHIFSELAKPENTEEKLVDIWSVLNFSQIL